MYEHSLILFHFLYIFHAPAAARLSLQLYFCEVHSVFQQNCVKGNGESAEAAALPPRATRRSGGGSSTSWCLTRVPLSFSLALKLAHELTYFIQPIHTGGSQFFCIQTIVLAGQRQKPSEQKIGKLYSQHRAFNARFLQTSPRFSWLPALSTVGTTFIFGPVSSHFRRHHSHKGEGSETGGGKHLPPDIINGRKGYSQSLKCLVFYPGASPQRRRKNPKRPQRASATPFRQALQDSDFSRRGVVLVLRHHRL